jgi:hypothetical protein
MCYPDYPTDLDDLEAVLAAEAEGMSARNLAPRYDDDLGYGLDSFGEEYVARQRVLDDLDSYTWRPAPITPTTDTHEAIRFGEWNMHHIAIQVAYNAWIRDAIPDVFYSYRGAGLPQPDQGMIWNRGFSVDVGLGDDYILSYFVKWGTNAEDKSRSLPDLRDALTLFFEVQYKDVSKLIAEGWYSLIDLQDLMYFKGSGALNRGADLDRAELFTARAKADSFVTKLYLNYGHYTLEELNNYIYDSKVIAHFAPMLVTQED